MLKKNVKLGIAPIGWTNDDLPELGASNTFLQTISEMALAGFCGTEIGNKYPKDGKILKTELKRRGMKIANCWFSTFLLTEPYEQVEKAFLKQCRFLKKQGAKVIGVSEQSYSIQGKDLPIYKAKYIMNDNEWDRLLNGLNNLGKASKNIGISLTYHHHMGTVIENEKEIDRFMAGTSPEYVSLLFDTGHLAYIGADYISVLKKYATRIKHVHLKDVRPEILKAIKDKDLSFLTGVKMGAFTVPGDGAIDFKPVFWELDKAGYKGWLLVEAEQDPSIANPLDYAKSANKYIKNLLKEF